MTHGTATNYHAMAVSGLQFGGRLGGFMKAEAVGTVNLAPLAIPVRILSESVDVLMFR